MTSKQAVYPNYQPKNSNPATLTLKDVPVDAFWSITVYDQGGWVVGEKFNVNSSFAKANEKENISYILEVIKILTTILILLKDGTLFYPCINLQKSILMVLGKSQS